MSTDTDDITTHYHHRYIVIIYDNASSILVSTLKHQQCRHRCYQCSLQCKYQQHSKQFPIHLRECGCTYDRQSARRYHKSSMMIVSKPYIDRAHICFDGAHTLCISKSNKRRMATKTCRISWEIGNTDSILTYHTEIWGHHKSCQRHVWRQTTASIYRL